MVVREVEARLYAWRMHTGLTLRQASDRTGLEYRVISRAELNAKNLALRTLLRVIDAYEITPARFFGPIPRVKLPAKRSPGRPALPRASIKEA